MDRSLDVIIRCERCGARNRVPESKKTETARCGKCEAPFSASGKTASEAQSLTLRCGACRTRNRVPLSKLEIGPKCGRCGESLQTQALLTGSPVSISDGNFDEQVLKSPLPVLMYSWAQWCSGCKTVTPVIHDIAATAKGKIRVGKLDVEANPALASRFGIMSIPFLHIFDSGQLKESFPGGMSKHDLMMKMAHYL